MQSLARSRGLRPRLTPYPLHLVHINGPLHVKRHSCKWLVLHRCPTSRNSNLAIPCSVLNRSTTTGLSQYLARQVYVGEGPKAKAVSISTNGSSTFEILLKSAPRVANMHVSDDFSLFSYRVSYRKHLSRKFQKYLNRL